jgi:hypothetical protein
MRILITENQFNLLNESKDKFLNLCDTLGSTSSFCKKLESTLKDSRKGGREKNMLNVSKNFFNKVVSNGDYFKTIVLRPGIPEYDTRIEQLIRFKDLLESNGSCPNIVSDVNQNINNLPDKELTMVVDSENQYSLLNRLDTHYSTKAYLLTNLILRNLDDKGNLDNINDEKLREVLYYVMSDEFVSEIAEFLSKTLETNKEFHDYFFGSLSSSRERGNQVENDVFEFLRGKYGAENVIEFSGDFGFVDYFGVDGVVIINGQAHPVQISTSAKSSPKIFQYTSESCKPLGFFKDKDKIIRYEQIS